MALLQVTLRNATKYIIRFFRGRKRVALPDDIIEEILDFVVLIPGTVDAFHMSPIYETRENTTNAQLIDLIVASRRSCASLALVNRRFYTFISKRMYWMMLHVASLQRADQYLCDPMILKRVTGGETIGALVTRFDVRIQYNTSETAVSACECLRQCVSLKHFTLHVHFGAVKDTESILETAATTFGSSLRTFECFLDYHSSSLPINYVSRMPRLTVFRTAPIVEALAQPYVDAPDDDFILPSCCYYLSFPDLHTLQVHRADTFHAFRTWDMPRLARFRADEEQSYDIPLRLTAVTRKVRNTLSILELRWLGTHLSHVLKENPFITEAVFDLRGDLDLNTDHVVTGELAHPNITCICIRGFTRPPFLIAVPHEQMPATLNFLLFHCEFTALRNVFLLDFSVEYFRSVPMPRSVGQSWSKVIQRCKDMHVKLLDRDSNVVDTSCLPLWAR